MCEAKFLDVKGTEQDSPLLWGWLPFWPDIKKKARIEILQGEDFGGLLPIASASRSRSAPRRSGSTRRRRTPRRRTATSSPRSGSRRPACPPANLGCLGIPTGLGHWTTEDSWAEIGNLPASAGVVIAFSFRPQCPGPANCFDINSYTDIDTLCNQGSGRVKCFYTTESGGNANDSIGPAVHPRLLARELRPAARPRERLARLGKRHPVLSGWVLQRARVELLHGGPARRRRLRSGLAAGHRGSLQADRGRHGRAGG